MGGFTSEIPPRTTASAASWGGSATESAADRFAFTMVSPTAPKAHPTAAARTLGRPDGASALPAPLGQALETGRRHATALPAAMRSAYEPRLHHDLSRVRVHVGDQAARMAAQVGASGFTTGADVVLGGRQSLADAHRSGLLAHELAHVAQLNGRTGLMLRRNGSAPTVRVAGAADRRDFVEGTIQFLESSADYFAAVTRAPQVDRVLRSWQTMVTTQGTMVLDDLRADAALFQRLRAAYRHALTTLMDTTARLSNRPVAALYEQHRALIPEWAFPSKQVVGITTPLPLEAQTNRRGEASLDSGGLHIIFQPDTRRRAAGAETQFAFSPMRINARTRAGRVTSITGPGQPTVRIHTEYGPRLNATVGSGYGRGTTREDVAAGDTTLGFHEGQHGRDFLRFFREHAYPQFTGRVGMSTADFRVAMNTYQAAVRQYALDLKAESLRRTDCVGTTIDQFDAQRGIRVRAQCH